MTRHVDKELIHMRMEQSMLASGKTISKTATESKNGQMDKFMKANIKMALKKERVS